MDEDKQLLPIDGFHSLYDALKNRLPSEILPTDLIKLNNDLLISLSDYINTGYQPAVAKANSDGSIDLIVFDIKQLLEGGDKKQG